jgi:RNA polymerase sigma-70 factor (ECF subfamily)
LETVVKQESTSGSQPSLAITTGVDFAFPVSESRSVTVPQATTNPPREDSSLVAAAQSGDRGAFGELYSKYARVVHGILLARIPPDNVDDLVHDVFLHAMRKLGTLRDAARFAGWLAAIARNRATDFHRRSRELVELNEDCAAEEERPQEEAVAILSVIRTLPDAYSETLVLRLVEGLTGPEIAARTGLTPGSVRVNLHRGMQQLRAKLGPKSGGKP